MELGIINSFSSVNSENVHTAIVATIAAELWKRHPVIHFQALGPSEASESVAQAMITFTYRSLVVSHGHLQNLRHAGTIVINNGICRVSILDTKSTYNNIVLLLEKQWPLEFPNFPGVLYDELAFLADTTNDQAKKQSEVLPYLFEVVKKSGNVRHLTFQETDDEPIKTFCGLQIEIEDVHAFGPSFGNYLRDGSYCCRCNDTRLFRERCEGNNEVGNS